MNDLLRSLLAAFTTLACLACLPWLACGGQTNASQPDPFAEGAEDAGADGAPAYEGTPAATDASLSYDATVSQVPAEVAEDAADAMADDADALDDSSEDGGDDAGCTSPLVPGALLIDELMIESVDGTGDHGEWLEVQNTQPCAVDLRGLHGDCPHGAKAASFDVAGDLWIPPGGWFVVADSVSPAIDHDVPLPVVAWQGNLGDVLRNKGTTVTLSANGAVIDTLTYPALTLTVGTSVEFPSDCDPSTRDDFSRWVPAQASWFPGFRGTPNAANADVSCPASP
jgi:hypothetical protein